jgi:hypothetical protein
MTNIETKEAEVIYEGKRFRLREIRSAVDIARLFAKTRLYSMGLENFKLSNGEVIDIPSDLAIACVWVEASLVEPKMSFQELVEMSLQSGALIFVLLEKTLELCGMLEEEEVGRMEVKSE